MLDPYRVLEVERSATDDEIKKAYRSLSRRYHPDANINNPNKARAEERFKLVQEAYEQIVKERQQGYRDYAAQDAGSYGTRQQKKSESTAWGSNAQGTYGGAYRTQSTYRYKSATEGVVNPLMEAAMREISNQRYEEAIKILNTIPPVERGGTWYYYSALSNAELGNKAMAITYIRVAVGLEPSNTAFRRYKVYLEKGGTRYAEMGRDYGYKRTVVVPEKCLDLGFTAGWMALMQCVLRCCIRR